MYYPVPKRLVQKKTLLQKVIEHAKSENGKQIVLQVKNLILPKNFI
jgi:hypothetical protein